MGVCKKRYEDGYPIQQMHLNADVTFPQLIAEKLEEYKREGQLARAKKKADFRQNDGTPKSRGGHKGEPADATNPASGQGTNES